MGRFIGFKRSWAGILEFTGLSTLLRSMDIAEGSDWSEIRISPAVRKVFLAIARNELCGLAGSTPAGWRYLPEKRTLFIEKILPIPESYTPGY